MIKKILAVSSIFLFAVSGISHPATIVNQRIGCVDMGKVTDSSPESKEIKAELLADLQTRKGNIKIFQSRIESLENEIKMMEEELSRYEQKIKPGSVFSSTGTSSGSSKDSSGVSPDLSYSVPSSSASASEVSTAVRYSTEPAGQNLPSVTGAVSQPVNTSTVTAPVMEIMVSSPAFSAADIENKKSILTKQRVDIAEYISATEIEEKNISRKIKKNLLGKIYDSIKEVVEEEGLTVILDSSNVVYDESMTDITDKVIDRLKKK